MKYDYISEQIELAAMRKAAEKAIVELNSRPKDDFCGLSAMQMTKVVRPIGSDGAAVGLRDGITEDVINGVPVFRLAEEMLRLAVGNEKLELTKLGYLKRKHLTELYQHGFLPSRLIDKGYAKLSVELDWFAAGFARSLLEIGRLIRRYKGNLVPTALGKKYAAGPRVSLFTFVFGLLIHRVDWAFGFDAELFDKIQDLAGYSFWLMHRFGSEWRKVDFYSEKFATAFPMILPERALRPFDSGIDELIEIALRESPEIFAAASPRKREKPAPNNFDSPMAKRYKQAYKMRTVTLAMAFLGVIELTNENYLDPVLVRKSDLFEKLLRIEV
jgi:hypothetical protein